MKKLPILLAMVILLLVMMIALLGCASKAYSKQGTSWSEAKQDYNRCCAEAKDLLKQGKFSYEDEESKWVGKCMTEKGYVLRIKEDFYPSSQPLGEIFN